MVIMLLLLLSGMAGLVYQVLWMKQLGLLFGNTSEAAAATLAAFFAGLAVGNWFWGRRTALLANPLRCYAILEIAIAGTALVYFAVLGLFYAAYTTVHQAVPGGWGLLGLKFALALLLVFPPAFCMGGTLPAVGQYLIRSRSVFGKTAAMIYSVNTFGAALGVVVAVFAFVPTMGFRLTYLTAMAISLIVGGVSWVLSRGASQTGIDDEIAAQETSSPSAHEPSDPGHGFGHATVLGLCFISGFGVLALEVLWTRMFAQIHPNSVYAFAVMLAVVLTGLAIGAWLSSWLARLKFQPGPVLGVLMTCSGVVLVLGPDMFMAATDGMKSLTSLESWVSYLFRMMGIGTGGIGLVVVVLGMVFPFIMKVQERMAGQPGRTLGGLLAANTLGSILGAMICGFVLLPWLGMWATMQWIAVMYFLVALVVLRGWRPEANACRLAAGLMLVLVFTILNPTRLPTTAVPPMNRSHQVLETWEGSDCTVAVVKMDNGSIAITLNSGYTLGSSGAYLDQVHQSIVPLLVYPDTRSIFYLGMGTGISTGAALDERFPNVERVVAAELVPQVITAAKTYFTDVQGRDLTGGVFEDPRATVLTVDGRHFLRVTDEKFDMINADLFLPYRRGAGNLYSLDHYLAAKKRLNPGGVYVQWLPMFQLTESEFGIIARTMLEAFDQVTMWRNNFTPGHEIVALIGQDDPSPIAASPGSLRAEMLQAARSLQWRQTTPDMAAPEAESIPFFYAGNLSAASELFDAYPINTDDNPLIEYQTPRTFRERADEQVIWFVGPKLGNLIQQIFEKSPPASDPVLANRTPANRRLAEAGAAFHSSMVNLAMGKFDQSQRDWQQFLEHWRAGAD